MLLHPHRAAREPSGPEPGAAESEADRIAPGTTMVLVAMGLGVLVIANDFTALNVAVPSIEQDLDTDVGTAQWVINAYCLVFGMAIVTGGRLADMFGRREAFFVGAILFAVFSAFGAAAQSTGWLIGSRVGMGVGAALMWPAILGMTYAALPASKAGLAGGLILGVAGLGNALGPLIGGALSELSWRWIFVLNVPIAALAIAVVWLKVHQPREPADEERIDYPGIASLSLGLLLLLLALDQAVDWGWDDWRVISMLAVSVVLIVAFGFIEPRMGRSALIPSDLLRNRTFVAACLVTLMISAVFFATVLYVPQFLQKILDWSPLGAGAGMLPMLGLFALTSFIAGPVYQRLGAKPTVAAGALLLAVGPLLLSLIEDDSGYGSVVAGLAVTGLGAGLFYPSVTTAAVTALDPSRTSLAGGLVYMFQIAGGAIGLGLTTTIFTTASEEELAAEAGASGVQLTHHQDSVAHGVLAGTESGREVIADFSGEAADRLLEAVRDSFAHGLQVSFRVVAAIAAVGFLIALFNVGGPLRRRSGGDSSMELLG
jgi:EmrB/QacA subfamily drug resistance transporter